MTQKQISRVGFQFNRVKMILKNTGIPRVSNESVVTLNKLMTRHARHIATKAVHFAKENGRETVRGEDMTRAVRMTGTTVAYEIEHEAPVVHNVWFISSGGTCLLSRSYSGIEFPDTIFSGLLTGILDLMSEVTGRLIEKFSTDDLTIHIRRISEITVAVICDSEKGEPIDELTDLIALRFSEVFSKEITLDIVDTSIFDDFAPVLDALVSSAGLNIPKERLKVIKTSVSLTDRELEESVDATALRAELRRAQAQIQDLALFKNDTEIKTMKSSTVTSMFDEPPDVTEIKAVLRQASQDIRQANGEESSTIENDVSREEIMKEISKDFSDLVNAESDIKLDKQIEEKAKPKVVKRKKTTAPSKSRKKKTTALSKSRKKKTTAPSKSRKKKTSKVKTASSSKKKSRQSKSTRKRKK
ncbi:MAG: histone-like protein [Candidatus Hodarchaeales archaeon]|jgi:histone H3/H4